jgi:hypothetical protein
MGIMEMPRFFQRFAALNAFTAARRLSKSQRLRSRFQTSSMMQ